MKIAMHERTDLSAGVQDEIRVSIESNAIAFHATINGLVKDKIAYPIRELCTNAWDASRGQFEVHLPTRLNPVFRVRDFGPGMSHDQMVKVYANLYASTKRDGAGRDTAVGGWGIGSKSPFAYLINGKESGSYTVVSTCEGMQRTYILSLNAENMPVMRLLAEQPSNAPSGLDVSFAVRRDDIDAFHQKAREILWSFAPRPAITPEIAFNDGEVSAHGTGWTKYRLGTVNFRGPQVRMGCVRYPLDLSEVPHGSLIESDDAVLFDAPIGSLQVTLSRENLAYDDTTKATLRGLVAAYERELREGVMAKVSAKETYFEACAEFVEQASHFGYYRQAALMKGCSWNGTPINLNLADIHGAKFMRLPKGWAPFDKFDRMMTVSPSNCIGYKVVVEHNPHRSFDRFAAAGLVGEPLLWVRCKREDKESVLADLGDPADVIVLDDVKVEKRAASKLRKRRCIVATVSGFQHVTDEIDMAEGGLFIHTNYRPSGWGGRRRHRAGYRVADGCTLVEEQLRLVVKIAVELGALDDGQSILIKTDEEVLGEDWTWLGDHLCPALNESLDPNALTVDSLEGKTSYNIDGDLKRLAHVSPDVLPEDLRTLKVDLAALVQRLDRHSIAPKTPSDKAADALKLLGQTTPAPNRVAVACPVDAINARWRAMEAKYVLLGPIMLGHRYSYYNFGPMNEQLRHYFELYAAYEAAQSTSDRRAA